MARLLGSPTSTGANNVDASASERAAGEAFALAAVFCFTFWDLYLPALGIRPLDLIGMMLLAVGLCSSYVRRSSLGLGGITSISVCLGGCAAAIAGVFADSSNVRAAIGVCLGTAIFMLFSVWPLSRAGVLRLLNALLVVNLCGFWLQFAVYFSTGRVLNYYAALGAEPRVLSKFFRAAGLYLEPADFALTAVSLIAVRAYIAARFDMLFVVTAVSVVCSLSLWGALAVAVLILLHALRTPWLLVPVAGTVGGLLFFVFSTGHWHDLYLFDRLTRLATDPSARGRYGGLLQFSAPQLWSYSFWFGQGVRVDYMELGLNSLSYLVTSVGAVGAIALVVATGLRARKGWRFYVGAVVLLALTATYMWTYMYWWSWLALLGRMDLAESGENRSIASRSAAIS